MSTSTPPQRPPKAMSSRLLTMKFMQRAAASSPPTSPQSQNQTPNAPPSKRQKTQAPTSTATPTSDLQLIQAALDDEEEKREKVIERLAEEAGETKWVLSIANGEASEVQPRFCVSTAGYSDLDQEESRPATVGRKSFGKFNRELERPPTADSETSSSSEEGSENSEGGEDEGSDDLAGTRELIRVSKEEAKQHADAERRALKARRKAERAETKTVAEKRRSKAVKLNRDVLRPGTEKTYPST
ncbi:hypothetical protein P7C71_g1747, partial [Lecanoromycetidae sp. Uapishka_2]